ncbi:MAG: Fic family protein [Candidatus Pacebacteria bacterium]|nr:Fic family protein [Candidatus Paceibacterota bacterium]
MRDIQDIPQPAFDSELNTVIVELEKLREKRLSGTVPPYVFFQLKEIFQTLESIGSNRIEGNRTTVTEYAEKVITGVSPDTDESMREIVNLDNAIDFLEKKIEPGKAITRSLLSEAHKLIVKDLSLPPDGEGSKNPGAYRQEPVCITGSDVETSQYGLVPAHCDELFDFINAEYATQYHLLVIALAHHRMTVIHPFDNGNGRLVRLLTYAQLLQQGFSVKSGRILNPTAIFCDNRDIYYEKLSEADAWTNTGLLNWCLYVLKGLAREIEKIDNLLDRGYLCTQILVPMLDRSKKNKYITEEEYQILRFITNQSKDMTLRAGDLEQILGVTQSVPRSRIINRALEKKLIQPIEENGRIYTLSFFGNYMFRELTQLLVEKGFVPKSLNAKSD